MKILCTLAAVSVASILSLQGELVSSITTSNSAGISVKSFAAPRLIKEPEQTGVVQDLNTNLVLAAESRPPSKTIKLVSGGAVAEFGRHKVRFDASADGGTDITAPDGRKLVCRATFLTLYDTESQTSVVLGRITNRIGLIAPSSAQVIYTNAFDGPIRADLIYRYTAHSLEQDIRFAQGFELPKAFKAENTRIQIWTEWFGVESVSKETQTLTLRSDFGAGEVTTSDETINLGAMKIVAGAAFRAGEESEGVPVAKTWFKSKEDGRTWLVETLDYLAIKPALDTLPKSAMSFPSSGSLLRESELLRSLRSRPKEASPASPMLIADSRVLPDSGVILDFVIVNSVPVPPGAVSWSPAGGNANDAIGNNDGSLRGEITFAAGKVGQGFSQDGYVDSANVGNPANLQLQDFTIEAWIKRASTTSASLNYGGGIFFSHGWGGYGFGVVDDGSLFLTRVGIDNVTLGQAITDTAWHHVAVTKSGTEAIIYVDGIGYLMPEYETWYDFYSAFAVGARGDYNLNSFLGQIDELAVYNRALSPSEIEGIYNAGGAGKLNPNCSPPLSDAIAWWASDGDGYDFVGANDGVLQNGATYEPAVAAQGFSFDGINDGVIMTDNNALDVGAGENFTVECWIKALPNNTTWGITTIADKRETPNPYQCLGWVFCLANGQVACRISDNISGPGVGWGPVGPNLVSAGGYHHVAMTLNRGSTSGGHMYVDGVSVLEFNPTGVSGSLANTHDLYVGVHAQSGFNGYHKGIIDELTVYKRELSATEISAIYSAGCAGKCKNDGDELPDSWEWQNFGNLNQGSSDDFDGDGRTNLQDYTDGTDPNFIQFSISLPSGHVNSGNISGEITVQKGTPAKVAIIVDSDDFSSAGWVDFGASISRTLTEGEHFIWVGLKGRAPDSRDVWKREHLIVDTTAPTITVISPTATTLTQPVLQLIGESSEQLSSLSYDLVNNNGTFNDQRAFIIDQSLDLETGEFTGCSFQCFDVELALGNNTLTLHATDLAGNTTTIVRTYVLDYTGDTQAPSITLAWPPNNAQIAADSFTLRGTVDDSTARVVVHVTIQGLGRDIEAIVARNGEFWVDDVPLDGVGTIIPVSVTAIDAKGNSSAATSINLTRSSITVAIDPVPEASLLDSTISIYGTVNDDFQTLLINGVAGEVSYFDGTLYHWVADSVPISSGGAALFSVSVDPSAPQVADAAVEVNFDKPPVLELESYFSTVEYTRMDKQSGQVVERKNNSTIVFAPGRGGSYIGFSKNYYDPGTHDYFAEIGFDGIGLVYQDGVPFVWRNFVRPMETSDWDDTGNYKVIEGVFWDHYYTRVETTLTLRTNGRERDQKPVRPLVFSPWAFDMESRTLNEIYSRGEIKPFKNLKVRIEQDKRLDGNGKLYDPLLPPNITIKGVKVLSETVPNSTKPKYRTFLCGLGVERPKQITLARSFHPKFNQVGPRPTRQRLQSQFHGGAVAAAEDGDPYPDGYIPDDDPRVNPEYSNPEFLIDLYLNDDVPVYLEFHIKDGPTYEDLFYGGPPGPYFPPDWVTDGDGTYNLQGDQFFEIRTEIDLDRLQEGWPLVQWKTVKLIQTPKYGKPIALTLRPSTPENTVATPVFENQTTVHEWGHACGIAHRGKLYEDPEGSGNWVILNPGDPQGALMLEYENLDFNPGSEVNRNERNLMYGY
jgi:hypothetical protein